MSSRFAPTALMLGNFVTGCSVLAPAGMLPELSAEVLGRLAEGSPVGSIHIGLREDGGFAYTVSEA